MPNLRRVHADGQNPARRKAGSGAAAEDDQLVDSVVSHTKALLLATAISICACNSHAPKAKSPARAEADEHGDHPSAVELSRRYGASTQWYELFDGLDGYTIDLQEALENPESQPILVYAYLNDIARKGNQLRATLAEATLADEVVFDLLVTADQADRLRHTKHPYPKFAVVVRVTAAAQPSVNLSLPGEDDAPDELVVQVPSGITVVRGVCIDLAHLGPVSSPAK